MTQIRPKSMVILLSDDHSKHVVSAHGFTRENPAGFHRLIGGGIEFGERRRDAAIREVEEELGVRLETVTEVGVTESIFEVDGEPRHEIVFVYWAYLPEGIVNKQGGTFAEADGCPLHVIWRDVTDDTTTLYPNGAQEIVSELAASLACT